MSDAPLPLDLVGVTAVDPAATGDPFVRVRFRPGMLLGAEDLTVEQRSGLLRHRLHQALLHGAGTVWGLGVSVKGAAQGVGSGVELEVGAGLALDALGRELYVPRTLCLPLDTMSVTTWSRLRTTSDPDTRRAWVVLRYEAAESQPVPVLREPGTPEAERLASSRVQDQARVDLEGAAPPEPMEQLMGWLGREGGPTMGEPPASLREALVRWLTAPIADLSGLWTSTVEGDREAPVQLAALTVVATLSADGQRRNVVSVAVDNDARPLVGGLGLVLDQLLGQRLAAPDSGAGPRARSIGITKVADSLGVELRFTAPLHHDTISGVRLLALGAGGWSRLTATLVPSADHRAMRLTPTQVIPDGSPVQIFLPGQGEGPILGEDGQPLCGWWDDPLPAFGRGVDVSWVGIWAEVTP